MKKRPKRPTGRTPAGKRKRGAMMRSLLGACAAIPAVGLFALMALPSDGHIAQGQDGDGRRKEIAAFNAEFLAAHLRMDTPAIIRMWAEDGISLLPGIAPLVGKPEIARFLDEVTARLKGWRMEKMEPDFRGIEVSGDWASEHQVVQPPDRGKPAFNGRGKMLLVLHREADGSWRIKREMWNQGEKEGPKSRLEGGR